MHACPGVFDQGVKMLVVFLFSGLLWYRFVGWLVGLYTIKAGFALAHVADENKNLLLHESKGI